MAERVKSRITGKNLRGVVFWFARHPESAGNLEGDNTPVMHDTPLTDTGRQEAENIAKYFQEQKIELKGIWSATNRRSSEGANIVAGKLNVSVHLTDKLNERNWGELKDKPWREVAEKLAPMPIKDRYYFKPVGGESWHEMEDRLLDELEEIAEGCQDGDNILIVTHRGSLRALLPLFAEAARDQHESYSMRLGSLSRFSFDKGEFDFLDLKPEF